MLSGIDSAYPMASPPASDVVCVYIGGDTPHVWSSGEITAQPARYVLPIFVRSNPGGYSGTVDASVCVAALKLHSIPKGVAVALDIEASTNPRYVADFDHAMIKTGYKTMLYESATVAGSNGMTSGGKWLALWDGHPTVPAGCVGHQYENYGSYDASVFLDSVPLWDRRPSTPSSASKVEEMLSYVTLPIGTSYIPVEPAGTITAPKGGAKNGPMWFKVGAQDSGSVEIDYAQDGKWVKVSTTTVGAGSVVNHALPTDGSVSQIRVKTTVPVIGYIVGIQV